MKQSFISSGKVRKSENVSIVAQQVSLAARIVPSPDWFIGLDSFNLCIDGQWVDSVAIKVIIFGFNSIFQILI
jgi:Spondin_N